MSIIKVKKGDIVFVKGNKIVSKAIKFITRSIGEEKTLISHVGIIDSNGTIDDCFLIEALSTVKRNLLSSQYGNETGIEYAIYRCNELMYWQRCSLVEKARSYIGKRYGYLKIVAHALDHLFNNKYVFRKLLKMDDYPICSWLVAHCYEYVGISFGIDANAATPDDIWDYVVSHKDEFEEIKELGL